MGTKQKKDETDLESLRARSILLAEYSKYGRFTPGERPPYPTLLKALDMESSERRLAAVARLETAEDGDSLLLLKSAIRDWYLPVRVLAVRILETMGESWAKEMFATLSLSDDFKTRFDALRLLAQLKDASLLPLFRNAMESEDPRISTLASEAVFSLGDRTGLASLIAKLSQGTHAEKVEAAGFLAAIEDNEAEAAVRDFLRSEDVEPSLREAISSSLDRARRKKN